MEGKGNISQYRERLDRTLASHDLANKETLKTLVKNQILRSSQSELDEYIDNLVVKRTEEVSNFLGMLRSASVNDDEGSKSKEAPHGGWKLKQDTREMRVMHREGPEGSPFHTLLAEGYVDGPTDVCLCISWESGLYNKWWPQITVPTFKIISSQCLQKVRIGEQISLVRIKVSWPLSAREVVVHYFEFEYFQDDLVIVLLNSISDLESINRSTHGFSKDVIPDAQDVVRIDLVGGFALQKVTADRSYFRTIANMDIKLDFVPPALINFVSRQLIGGGFRLYQKEVASVSKGDKDFAKALKDSLYDRIREALYSNKLSKEALKQEGLKSNTCILPEEHPMKTMQAEARDLDKKVLSDDHAIHSAPEDSIVIDQKALGEIEEIEEEEIEQSKLLEEDNRDLCDPPTNQVAEKCHINNKKKVFISPEVEQALGTLEKVTSFFREYGFYPQTRSLPVLTNEKVLNLEKDDAAKDSKSSEGGQICSNGGVCVELLKDESIERTSHQPRNSSASHGSRRSVSNSHSREANHNRMALASADEDIPNPSETQHTALCSSENETTEATILEKIVSRDTQATTDANGINENGLTKRKNKKLRLCCLYFG